MKHLAGTFEKISFSPNDTTTVHQKFVEFSGVFWSANFFGYKVVFRSHSGTYDGVLYKNISRLKTVNSSRKILRLRYLTGFWWGVWNRIDFGDLCVKSNPICKRRTSRGKRDLQATFCKRCVKCAGMLVLSDLYFLYMDRIEDSALLQENIG